jgi:hypothetical protein
MDEDREADEFEHLLDAEASPAANLEADDPEAPDADRFQQAEIVELRQAVEKPSRDPEAPEADAIEQSEIVIGGVDPEEDF